MILAKIRVTGVYAQTVAWQEIPARISGAMVEIEYADPLWDYLDKTVVFRGCVTRDVLRAGTLVQIPPECVEMPGASLKIGVYGTGSDNTVAIPTLWADLGRVKDAADPSGDESTAPSLPVWAQLSAIIGDLDALETEAKASLVEAINEAATKGGGSVSEDEVQAIVAKYLQDNPVVVTETDPTVPGWAKQPQKPSYTAAEVGARPASWMPSASDVGADSAGTAAAAVSGHNTAADAHNDIRLDLKAINDRLTAFFDSDDQTLDELSEIVAFITSNKSLIDAITTSKVSVSDIVDNLTTNVANRPLSAAQGVVLNNLISTVGNNLSKYQPKGDYALRDEIPTKPEDIGALPGTYTPPDQTAEQVGADPAGTAAAAVSGHNTAADAHYDIRLDLKKVKDRLTAFFDSDDQTLDELSEIVAYITSNKSLIDAITTSKVSVSDIVNNLTTNAANRPLSAAQGVVLNGLITTVSNNLSKYQPKGDYALRSEIPARLPNPFGLFINNRRYDGHAAVDMDLQERICDEKPGATLAENVYVTSGNYAWVNYHAVKGYDVMRVIYDGVTYTAPITFGVESGDPSDPVDARYFYVGNVVNLAPEYPFSIVGYAYENGAEITVGSGTHAMSVILDPFVKTIDPKFLPDDIGGVDWDIIPKESYTMDGDAYHSFGEGFPVLVNGKKYIVSIDGVEYERTAKYYDDGVWQFHYIGNIQFWEPSAPADVNNDIFFLHGFDQGEFGSDFALYLKNPDYTNKTIVFGVREKKESGGSGGGAQPDWNAAEGEPGHILNRTHWAKYKEEEIANGEFTSQYLADMGVFAINLNYDYNIGLHGFLRRLPNKLTVEFDGVTYADRVVTPINDMGNAVGNLFYLNTIAGTSFPNTGEPFLMFVSYGGATIMLLDTQPTTHSIRMYSVGLCYKKPIAEYSAEIPMIDLTKYITSLVVDSPVRITSGDYQKDVYEVLASYDTVKIKYKYSGGWDGTVVAHPIEYGGIAEIHIRCLITDTTDLGYKILSIRARTDYVDVKIYEGK